MNQFGRTIELFGPPFCISILKALGFLVCFSFKKNGPTIKDFELQIMANYTVNTSSVKDLGIAKICFSIVFPYYASSNHEKKSTRDY